MIERQDSRDEDGGKIDIVWKGGDWQLLGIVLCARCLGGAGPQTPRVKGGSLLGMS